MARAGEAGQIHADRGRQHLGGAPADAWNSLQPRAGVLKRAHTLGHLRAHPLEGGVQEVEVGQRHGR